MFDVEVAFGNQTFQLLLDTGSSDIWVVTNGYQCINATDTAESPGFTCNFGLTYHTSSTFTNISGMTFGIEYGAGTAIDILDSEDVILGDIAVKQQTVGIVQSAFQAVASTAGSWALAIRLSLLAIRAPSRTTRCHYLATAQPITLSSWVCTSRGL